MICSFCKNNMRPFFIGEDKSYLLSYDCQKDSHASIYYSDDNFQLSIKVRDNIFYVLYFEEKYAIYDLVSKIELPIVPFTIENAFDIFKRYEKMMVFI